MPVVACNWRSFIPQAACWCRSYDSVDAT